MRHSTTLSSVVLVGLAFSVGCSGKTDDSRPNKIPNDSGGSSSTGGSFATGGSSSTGGSLATGGTGGSDPTQGGLTVRVISSASAELRDISVMLHDPDGGFVTTKTTDASGLVRFDQAKENSGVTAVCEESFYSSVLAGSGTDAEPLRVVCLHRGDDNANLSEGKFEFTWSNAPPDSHVSAVFSVPTGDVEPSTTGASGREILDVQFPSEFAGGDIDILVISATVVSEEEAVFDGYAFFEGVSSIGDPSDNSYALTVDSWKNDFAEFTLSFENDSASQVRAEAQAISTLRINDGVLVGGFRERGNLAVGSRFDLKAPILPGDFVNMMFVELAYPENAEGLAYDSSLNVPFDPIPANGNDARNLKASELLPPFSEARSIITPEKIDLGWDDAVECNGQKPTVVTAELRSAWDGGGFLNWNIVGPYGEAFAPPELDPNFSREPSEARIFLTTGSVWVGPSSDYRTELQRPRNLDEKSAIPHCEGRLEEGSDG